VIVKFIGLLNNKDGSEWAKLSSKIGIAEALMDASLQYVLTLFVVFLKADQKPSFIQRISLFTNLVFLALARCDAWLMDLGGMPDKERLTKTITLLPWAITNGAFKLGSISFICSILRYNCIYFYGPIFGGILLVSTLFAQGILPPEKFHLMQGSFVHAVGIGKISKQAVLSGLSTKLKTIEQTSFQQTRNIIVQNIFWFAINTLMITVLIILVNVYPDATIRTFYPLGTETIVLSEMAVVGYVNYFGPAIILIGTVSLALTYIQCHFEMKEDDILKISRYQTVSGVGLTPSPWVQTFMMMLDNVAHD